MRLSQQVVQSSQAYIDDMDTAHSGLLRGLTVRLHGMVGPGNRSSFTGSGFILRVDSPNVYVITAKHNLHVAATGMNKRGAALRDYFMQKIQVEFIRINGQAVQGAITAILFPDNTADDEHYDVAILRVQDMAYAQHVATFMAPSRSIMCLFAAPGWQKKQDGWIVEVFSKADAQEVLANGVSPYHLEGVEYPDARKNYSLVQFGWGLDNQRNHTFRERVLPIASMTNRTYLPTTHEGYEDVFTFDTDGDNTTQPGDSGGPIFALDATGTHSWLIGVALGANYYSNKSDNTNSIKNNAFNVISTNRISAVV